MAKSKVAKNIHTHAQRMKAYLDDFRDAHPHYNPLKKLRQMADDGGIPAEVRVKIHQTLASYLVPKPTAQSLPQPLPESLPMDDKKAAMDKIMLMVGRGDISEERGLQLANLLHAHEQIGNLEDVAGRLIQVEREILIEKNPWLK